LPRDPYSRSIRAGAVGLPLTMPAPSDWIATVRQAGPRFLSLLAKLQPTFHLRDITALDRAFIAKHAVSAVLWDVDGTLMPHHHRLVAPGLEATLAELRGHVPQAILSNCGDERFVELGGIFPDLPVLKGYLSEGRILLRRLERGRDLWKAGGSTIPRPAGSITAVKKPSGELIGVALDELAVDVERRALALMVGDQHFTDIAGANLAGIRSAKVQTIAPRSFPVAIRCFQLFERAVYRVIHDHTSG
jgi:predicted HAD superfamily phosphohydrolase YqeG